jgi:uncharacterized protein YceK
VINPKTARIIAAIVVAMMVLTLAATLFGCGVARTRSSSTDTKTSQTRTSGTKVSQTRTSAGMALHSGLTLVVVEDLPPGVQ